MGDHGKSGLEGDTTTVLAALAMHLSFHQESQRKKGLGENGHTVGARTAEGHHGIQETRDRGALVQEQQEIVQCSGLTCRAARRLEEA